MFVNDVSRGRSNINIDCIEPPARGTSTNTTQRSLIVRTLPSLLEDKVPYNVFDLIEITALKECFSFKKRLREEEEEVLRQSQEQLKAFYNGRPVIDGVAV